MVKKLTENNLFLINSPAGSGKTTTIENMISKKLALNLNRKILCITYTNRAADELMSRVQSEKVQIQTIHSFFSSFMKIYFSHEEIINLYFEIYGEEIQSRIENKENKKNIQESNERYIERNNELTFDIIKKNIHKIFYNELAYNNLYHGGLSHDDLLSFSKTIIERFPMIKKRLTQKYGYIFIDEYQDSSSSVLDIFYQSVLETNTTLYLFGDKMQQIYQNYDGNFENQLRKFDTSIKLNTNYRSSNLIIDVLNNIYNDQNFKQVPNPKKRYNQAIAPKVYICDNVKDTVAIELEKKPKTLSLYVFNKDRFNVINAGNLYDAVGKMEKYQFGRKNSPIDVLTSSHTENPDGLFQLLFLIGGILENYKKKQFGIIIQTIRRSNYFNKEILLIKSHKDKEELNRKILSILNFYTDNKDYTIKQFLQLLIDEEFASKTIINDFLMNVEYTDVLHTRMSEFRNLYNYLENPTVSTQHGVKGEGHDSVFFIADDSSRTPRIEMYKFFSLWSTTNISFTTFQQFFYDYSDSIKILYQKLNINRVSEIKSQTVKTEKQVILEELNTIYDSFKENDYFIQLFSNRYNTFFDNPILKNLKEILNLNELGGILSAYKLFYVGCSRAKKNLTVFIDNSKLNDTSIDLVNKLKEVGFEVENR